MVIHALVLQMIQYNAEIRQVCAAKEIKQNLNLDQKQYPFGGQFGWTVTKEGQPYKCKRFSLTYSVSNEAHHWSVECAHLPMLFQN